jgi:rod shape determining protein RodA
MDRVAATDLTKPGWIIVGCVAALVMVGVASIYVTNTHYSSKPDGPANAASQCVAGLVGLVAAWYVLRIGFRRIAGQAYLIFLIALVGLLPLVAARLLHSDFGGLIPERNGARRWIQLPGSPLQPSEFMKLAYILALAWYLRYRKNYRRFMGLVVPFAVSMVPLGMILIQPDLGTALLIIPVLFAMLYIAGARLRHLLILMVIGAAMVPLAWPHMKDYQRLRVSSVLLQSESLREAVLADQDQWAFLATRREAANWANRSGYQLVQSVRAVATGGFFGQGWGQGVYVRQSWLPDRHNDFIFAIIAHQFGLVGCLFVLLCYGVFVAAGTFIASAASDPGARLLAVGIVALVAAQVMINVSMTVGLMPITGMTLPFISKGGSSLLANMVAAALLISVAQERPYVLSNKPHEYGREREEQLIAARKK